MKSGKIGLKMDKEHILEKIDSKDEHPEQENYIQSLVYLFFMKEILNIFV